ncbi:MAG: tetratricopeptide repeat protein [Gemmatimonadetes bacterium]|nr:tetratricopeptide repeat protein [Gemmatimonadota bacterium]
MTALALCLALAVPDPSYARAESLLQARRFPAALRAAERVVGAYPCDPQAHLLLGRIHFARPVIGRYPALQAFRTAARLAPDDPEPLYWQMRVGLYLGSDDGDWIAREALLGIFALAPDYRDSWRRFQEVYRGAAIWRRAERALASHPDDPLALERRAELAIALEEPARAETLLARAIHRRPAGVTAYLLRAEASFLMGRDAAGYAWYDSALALAVAERADTVWEQLWVIASPDEGAQYGATEPDGRRRFFERFWGSRDPNLVTPENERIAEHYRRRAEARRMYRLLHPQRLGYRSATARALAAFEQRQELRELAEGYPAAIPGGSSEPGAAASRVALLDPRDLLDTAMTRAARAGIDARGLTFMRHGPPALQVPCTPDPLFPQGDPYCVSALDSEGWLYWTPEGPVSIGFHRRGEYFMPVSRHQVRSLAVLLRTDRTALPAPLQARGWSAFFKSGELWRTDVYFKSAPDTAAVVLWDETGEEMVRARGPGLLALTVPPGRYDYGFDVDSAGVQGRVRGTLTVPAFSLGDLGLSSLALAPADSLTDRETTLDRMSADLAFPAGRPLAAYAEVYGLVADAQGRARYDVRYTFEPVRGLLGSLFGPDAILFEFEREVEARHVVPEQLVIEPGRIPPGRYRVSLAVTDLRRNVKSESVALEITIR